MFRYSVLLIHLFKRVLSESNADHNERRLQLLHVVSDAASSLEAQDVSEHVLDQETRNEMA